MVNGRKVGRPPGTISKGKTSKLYQCTACLETISSSYEAALHPLLDCLICRKCYTNYGTGDFSHEFEDGVDDQGDDNYCRWCCDGGELFGCARDSGNGDRCHYSFCRDCIQRNVPDDYVLKLDTYSEAERAEMRWFCYGCDKSKLAKLRRTSESAMKDLNERVRQSRPVSPRPSQNKKRKLEVNSVRKQKPNQDTTEPSEESKRSSAFDSVSSTSPIRKVAQTLTPANKTPTKDKASSIPVPSTNTSASESSAESAPKPALPTESTPTTGDTAKAATSVSTDKQASPPTSKQASPPTSKQASPPTSKQASSPTSKSDPQSPPKSDSNQAPMATAKPAQPSTPLVTSKPTNKPDQLTKPAAALPPEPTPVSTQSTTTTLDPISNSNSNSSSNSNQQATPKTVSASKPSPQPSPNSRPALATVDPKPRNETPRFSKPGIKPRLDTYRSLMESCVSEIRRNFNTATEMLLDSPRGPPERRRLEVDIQIDTLRKPINEFEMMLADLKKLNHAL